MLLVSHTEGMGIQLGVLFFGKLFQFMVSHKSDSILPLWSDLLAWTISNYSLLFCWLLPVDGVQITPCLLCLRNNYTAGQTMNLFDLWVLSVGYSILLCFCNNFLQESHILFNTFCSSSVFFLLGLTILNYKAICKTVHCDMILSTVVISNWFFFVIHYHYFPFILLSLFILTVSKLVYFYHPLSWIPNSSLKGDPISSFPMFIWPFHQLSSFSIHPTAIIYHEDL